MGNTKYCTFWYPTIYHQDPVRLCSVDDIKHADISDPDKIGSVPKYQIDIKLDESENLIVTSTLASLERPLFVVLQKTNICRNGFVQYSFDTGNIPREHLEEFEKVLEKDVYHLAKEFYHTHEADSGKDSALRAIIKDKAIPLNTDDNVFLLSFLENFAPVFTKYAENISDSNKEVKEVEQLLEEIEMSENVVQNDLLYCVKARAEVLKVSTAINKMCENASIEYTYCKTLLSSRYNKSFVHTLDITEPNISETDYEEKKTIFNQKEMRRKQSLNIRNSMRYIENIKYKNQNRFNMLSQYLLHEVREVNDIINQNTLDINRVLTESKKTEKISLLFAIFSVFTSIMFGIVYFIDHPNRIRMSHYKNWFIVFLFGAIAFLISYFNIRLSKKGIPKQKVT